MITHKGWIFLPLRSTNHSFRTFHYYSHLFLILVLCSFALKEDPVQTGTVDYIIATVVITAVIHSTAGFFFPAR